MGMLLKKIEENKPEEEIESMQAELIELRKKQVSEYWTEEDKKRLLELEEAIKQDSERRIISEEEREELRLLRIKQTDEIADWKPEDQGRYLELSAKESK